jgi:hypothetical protein
MLKDFISDFVYRLNHHPKELSVLLNVSEERINKLSAEFSKRITKKKRQHWRRQGEIPVPFYEYLTQLGILPECCVPGTQKKRTIKEFQSMLSKEAGKNDLAFDFLSMIKGYPIEKAIAAQMVTAMPDEYGSTRRRPPVKIFTEMAERMHSLT